MRAWIAGISSVLAWLFLVGAASTGASSLQEQDHRRPRGATIVELTVQVEVLTVRASNYGRAHHRPTGRARSLRGARADRPDRRVWCRCDRNIGREQVRQERPG